MPLDQNKPPPSQLIDMLNTVDIDAEIASIDMQLAALATRRAALVYFLWARSWTSMPPTTTKTP